jgi:hypothetical protein
VTGSKREKRQVPRIQPYVAPCRILVPPQRLQGYATDLSARGAQIVMSVEPPPLGALVTLEIRLGRQVPSSRFEAEVKWRKDRSGGGFAIGLTFQELSDSQREALDGVLAEMRRRAAELA